MGGMDQEGDVSLPINGRDVSQVAISRFTPFLRIHFWHPGPEFTLEIEGSFRLVSSGVESLIDPERGPDPTYLTLVDKTVAHAIARRDGGLEVTFSDGDRLIIPPDRYEPWQLNGNNGYLVVSVAGGGLAIWSGKD
jgi:hypothetical protein